MGDEDRREGREEGGKEERGVKENGDESNDRQRKERRDKHAGMGGGEGGEEKEVGRKSE